MKSFFGGSAVIAAALLATFLVFSARPSVAETFLSQFQQQKQETTQPSTQQPKGVVGSNEAQDASETNVSSSATLNGVVREANAPAGSLSASPVSPDVPAAQASTYVATAYSLSGRTASGKRVARGLIAADVSVLPLGTRVHVAAGQYSGEYLVADTGGAVRGKHIDIWTPNPRDAMRFGRRTVKLTVLSYGPKHSRVSRKTHK
jgi:3D (Asp-Asp-Asp) domain-containing protein